MNDDIMNNCIAFKSAYADMFQAIYLAPDRPVSRTQYLVIYTYCRQEDCFFVLRGVDKLIECEPLYNECGEIVDSESLQLLYEAYEKNFLDDNRHSEHQLTGEEFISFSNAWQVLYKLLIEPWLCLQPENADFIVLFQSEETGKSYHFDFRVLHNLKYRFFKHEKNENVYFTTVNTNSIYKYIINLGLTPFPSIQKTVLLKGLKDINQAEASFLTEEQKRKLDMRKRALEVVTQAIGDGGGRVMELYTQNDFCQAISEGQPTLLHILTHFINGRLYTRAANGKTIGIQLIYLLLEELKEKKLISNGIMLDFSTCHNAPFLTDFYNLFLGTIFMSYHKLSTSLSIFTLYEMYTGENATRLKWDPVYLNGVSYLPEIYSRIQRCFYTHMFNGDDPYLFYSK